MTTRRWARLIIGTASLALIGGLLFSGSGTSAARGDRAAPTSPTNLVVTAVTTTTVSLSWNPSTDNSGKFSYKLRITHLKNSAYNSLATISQTQTTYTAKFLDTNSPYTFSIYAIDGSGNRSADSNLASANTLADTTAPNAPVLQAIVLGPSQVQLIWPESTDRTCCAAYSINMNGSPYTGHLSWAYASTGKLSVLMRHLEPGSTNTFSVNARNWSGNSVTSNTVTTTTEPSSDVIPPTAPTNLRLVRDFGCGEVDIAWAESFDETDEDYIEYEVYVNGVLSPLPVSLAPYAFVYGNVDGDNVFTVKAVDRSGNTSQASAPLTVFLWPC